MNTTTQVHTELEAFFEKNYYAEDFELQAEIKAWRDRLSEADRVLFDQVIVERLASDTSILNISICTRLGIPEAIPTLVALLDQETVTSQRSRTIMAALGQYSEDQVFLTVERFMDSDQEREAFRILARVNFHRAKSYIVRMMFRTGYEEECLHIFHNAKKKHGLSSFITTLTEWEGKKSLKFRKRVRTIFRSKKADFNPFTDDEVSEILDSFRRFG